MLECHGLLCLLYMLLGLLVCEYIQTYSHGLSLAIHVARFSGSSEDLLSLGGVERSRARKSNPVRSLWIGAAPSPCCRRQLLFRCPYLCKEPSMVVIYRFEPLWLMNPFYSCAYVLGSWYVFKRAHQSDSWAGVWPTLVCVQWYSGGVSHLVML